MGATTTVASPGRKWVRRTLLLLVIGGISLLLTDVMSSSETDFSTRLRLGSSTLRTKAVATTSSCDNSSTVLVQEEETAIFRTSRTDPLTLRPSDLPGYTGWGRPSTSLAPLFQIVGASPSNAAQTGQNWTVTIECRYPSSPANLGVTVEDAFEKRCRTGGSFFYVRAYGKSILPGLVHDYGNGTYDITILPFDAGVYYLEVVMTFSNPPPVSIMPIEQQLAKNYDMGYEGYMLPGFPVEFEVRQSEIEVVDNDRPCTIEDLRLPTSRNQRKPWEMGRWVLLDKNRESYMDFGDDTAEKQQLRNATQRVQRMENSIGGVDMLTRYQSGINSVGFQMDYRPNTCRLMSKQEAADAGTPDLVMESKRRAVSEPSAVVVPNLRSDDFKVIMIGDSNMNIQYEFLNSMFGGAFKGKAEFISDKGGLLVTIADIKKRLSQLAADRTTKYYLIANAGLHDLDRLCTSSRATERAEYLTVSDREFFCTRQYEKSLREFLEVIGDFPAELKVWETTTGTSGLLHSSPLFLHFLTALI